MVDGKSILIIEDEHFISELYARALKKAGCDVTIMMSGEDGLKAATQHPFDLVLLDILVPGLSGMEVLDKLRAIDATTGKHTKIIITTNLEQDEKTRNKLEHMADGYLIKAEMTPNELVRMIKDYLSNR